jgi:periplasmic protein TonB
MFEDATFHSRGLSPSQTPKWMLVTLAINLTVLASLILLPLISPASLPTRLLHRVLATPPPALGAKPQPHTSQAATMNTSAPRNLYLATPTIPTLISTQADQAPAPLDLGASPIGAVPGGANLPSAFFHSSPPPAIQSAPPVKLTISGGVTAGLLLYQTNPVYPVIAKTVGISGTVVLAATISKTGSIANLHVLSGPAMLRQSAIDAVQNWRYRPYLLNNQPVEVETTINVVFSLGNH